MLQQSYCYARHALLLGGCLAGVSPAASADSLPTGGAISAGKGKVSNSNPRTMVITQVSARMTVEWSSFDVGKNGSVIFEQPGKDSVALNRIHGGPSTI